MYTCACADLFFLISIISSLELHLFEVFNALTSLEYVHSAHYMYTSACTYIYMCMYAYRPLTIVNRKRTPIMQLAIAFTHAPTSFSGLPNQFYTYVHMYIRVSTLALRSNALFVRQTLKQ